MKKQGTLILMICLMFLIHSAQAQLKIGLVGGPQVSAVPGNANPGWDSLQYTSQKRIGWRVGLIADVQLGAGSPVFLQTGFLYSNKGQRLSVKYDSTTNGINEVKGFQYTNYIEVPMNLFYKMRIGEKSKFFIGGGPYIGFLQSGKERTEVHLANGSPVVNQNTDLKISTSPGKYSNIDYGWTASTGVEIGRFIINAQYSSGMKDFYQATTKPGARFRHQALSAAVGYYIFYNADRQRNKQSKDQDDDGVPDNQDACPDKPGTVASNGCPDEDGDGIADKVDKCPDVAGLAKFNGCPAPDRDQDGIPDAEDKCPDQAGVKQYGGCVFPDKDKDGVPDEQDKCPDVSGPYGNDGCPEIKKEVKDKIESVTKTIQFNYKSILLLPSSKRTLNKVVALLKEHPELNVVIEGHASSDGNPSNHEKLAYARASSVKIYLESKGIAPSRLKLVSYGASQPLVNGTSEKALSKNRRVEMKISNQP